MKLLIAALLLSFSFGRKFPYTIVFYIQRPIEYEAVVNINYSGGAIVEKHKVSTGSSC